MAELDFNTVEEISFEDDVQFKDSRTVAAVAGQITSIRNAISPRAVVGEGGDISPERGLDEQFLQAQSDVLESSSISEVTQAVADEFNNYYKGVIADLVEDTVETSDIEEVSNVLQDVKDLQEENDKELAADYNLEVANILAIEGKIDRARAERMFMARTAHDLIDGTTVLETVRNTLEFLLPDAYFDAKDFAEKYTDDPSINPFNDIKSVINKFWSLPRETRLKLWPHLAADIIKTSKDFGTVNEHKAAVSIMRVLDPHKDLDLNLESVFAGIDLSGMGIAALASLSKLSKQFNAIKRIKDSGDIKTAAKANAASAADSTVAATLEQDSVVAASNMNPFKYEEVMPEAADGLSAESTKLAEAITKRKQQVEDALEPVVTGKGFLRESALTNKERDVVEAKAIDNINQLKDHYYENNGWHLEDAEIINRSEDGFEISYKLEGIDNRIPVKYTINDIGEFDVLEAGAIQTRLWSPEVWMDRILKDSVEIATRINFAQGNLLGSLRDAAQLSMKGLSNKGRSRVSDVLLTGDDAAKGEGAVYTISELKQGINTPSGKVVLNDKEIVSYYAQRDIFDAMHFLKNKQVRSQLDFNGFRQVDVGGELSGTYLSIAKPYDSVGAIPSDVYQKSTMIWDARLKGATKQAASLNFSDVYSEGYRVVKAYEPFDVGGNLHTYAIVKADNVADLPMTVLNKKVGYVPKVYEDGWYFVKSFADRKVDGKLVPHSTTHRIFDNRTDANKWAAEQNLTADAGTEYKALHDRELTTSELDGEIINEMGGLYTGHRSTHQLKYGLGEGDIPLRISATDAMQRNLQNIANTLPMNEWRMGMVQRWINSAKGKASNTERGLDAVINIPEGKEKRALLASRDWIRDQLRLPTKAEEKWSATVREAAEWMESKPLLDTSKLSVRRGAMNLSSKDPFSAMRGASFHSLLGWFNPAQLFVQAQGASVALSLDPLAAPKRLQELTALRAAYFVRNNAGAITRTAKAAGVDPKELKDTLKQLEKTGLFESIKSNADYAASAQGFGVGIDAVRRAADKGLIFFTEGERFTRGYAFLTARANWIKANPGKKIDDDALKEIMTGTVKKMLNLNRANRAHWQKGAFSIPTQFMQVTAKFIESMMPNILPGANRKFTATDKRKIMLGQLALYGGAGVPFGTWVAGEMANQAGFAPGEIPDGWAAAATDGFWGALTEMMFDERFVLGERGGFLSGVTQLVDRVFVDEAPFSELAFGAFGEIPSRAFKGYQNLGPLVMNVNNIEWTSTEALTAVHAFGDIISTYSNAHKALEWYRMGHITDSRGRVIADLDENGDMAAAIGKAIGINPRRLADHYERKNFNKGRSKDDAEKATAYRRLITTYIKADPSPEDIKNFKLLKKWMFDGVAEDRVNKIVKNVHKQIHSGKTEEDKVIMQTIRAWFTDEDATAGTSQVLFGSGLTEEE